MVNNNTPTEGFLGKLWDTVSGFFAAMFEKVWTGFSEMLWKAIDVWVIWLTGWMQKIDDLTWGLFTKFAHNHKWIDDETRQDLNTLTELTFPFNLVAYTVAATGMLTTWLKQLMFAAGADQRRKIFSKYEPADIDANSLLSASLIAPEKLEEIKVILKNTGYGDAQIDLLFTAIKRAYDEGTVKTLYLRGVINDDRMYARMRELGYTTEKINEIKEAWPLIPGPADLFHLVAKEAFEPDIIEHYGYADEYPVEQTKWLKMQGISDYWAQKYWYAHWDTPSIGQGFEMLHRGFIDAKELDDLFRTIEIPPFWRDKLTKIAFNPFTRVDVRRMHKAGVLTEEELLAAYMDVGYSEDKAAKMTEFTILYNGEGNTSLTKAQILNGFTEYILTREDTAEMLGMLKVGPDEAEFLITFEEYERDKKLQTEQIKSIKKRYLLSLTTFDETSDRLNRMDLPSQKKANLLEAWELQKYDQQKIPTKSELARLMKSKIITEEIYREEMQKLNYIDRYIDWYLLEIDQATRKELYNGD